MKRVNRMLNYQIGVERLFREIWDDMDDDSRKKLTMLFQNNDTAKLREQIKEIIYKEVRGQE